MTTAEVIEGEGTLVIKLGSLCPELPHVKGAVNNPSGGQATLNSDYLKIFVKKGVVSYFS